MDDAGLRELLKKATPRPVRAVWEPADFDLAVAAVNSLPRLVGVSEASRAVVSAFGVPRCCDSCDAELCLGMWVEERCGCPCHKRYTEAQKRLREGMDALESAVGSGKEG